MCNQKGGTINHILSECKMLAQKEDKRRHDNIRDFKQRERGRRRGLQNPQKDWGENDVVAGISKQLSSHYKTPLMMSLKEVRNQLLISHDDGVINDEELLLLYDLNRSDNLDLPYNSYPGFDFDNLEDDECLSEFRFYKNDLPFLAEVLGIPEVVQCYQRSICSGLEALCIFLKRHSYPCRYSDMIARFGKPVPVLCMINNYMIDYIYQEHSHRILQWNDTILNPHSLEIYSNAITAKGSPLDNCFGFIDGTVRPISKPGQNQRVVYNGHKRVHGVKFQSVALPNGIIGNMYGPIGKGNGILKLPFSKRPENFLIQMFLIVFFFFHRGQTTRRCHASRLQSSSRYAALCFFTWCSGSSTMCLWRPCLPIEGAPPDPF